MEDEIISISDSDEEAAPFASASTSSSSTPTSSNNSSTQKQKQPDGSMIPTFPSPASVSSGSTMSSPSSNLLDIATQSSFESTSGMSLYRPLGADLMAARQLEAMKKKKLSIMQPFPVVRDVVNKMRSALGTNDSQLNVLGLAQQYITSLKYYQASIVNCPNRCRLLARHIIQTMCLIRDLSRHFFDSPHYSQKICELLAIYIYFELQCAGDFKDSKTKIAERIIHNIHLHLENAHSNFVLRIFSFLSNMGKENEIATKVFRRLIPEVTVMVKNEFPDRLYVQYLIVFYHWKEAWNDYEDQQKIVTFANQFMKPMSTIKTNQIYAKHLPCYVRRDDATGYFLTNMVFFNDLRNASILDGIQDNGPTLVDLSEDEKVYPIIDLAGYTMEKVYPILDIKTERREVDGTVDLTEDDDESWLKRLIRRAVALEVILPARLTTRKEDQAPAVIELIDSDNENANKNNVENEKANGGEIENENENENEDEDDDDSWAFGPRNENQQPEQQEIPAEVINVAVAPAAEESNSMDEIYNEMNSSIDFGDDSTTESEIERKKEQKERYEYASKLTDAQARITFDGVVEKELKAMYFQNPTASVAAAADQPTSSKSVVATKSNAVEPVDQPTISKPASVSENPTSSKVAVASEKTTSMEAVVAPTKNPILKNAAEAGEKSSSPNTDAISEEDASLSKSSANEEPTLFTSEDIEEVQKSSITNEKAKPTEVAKVVVEQVKQTSSSVDQTLNKSISDQPITNILQETQAPKEAVTFTMDDTLLSSFDSSDESDEDFVGRFQQPPFKTYLRRAHRKSSKKSTKNNASSSEEDANANVEKLLSPNESESNKQSTPPELPSSEAHNDNANILFSGKVISLREDENSNGAGGATPNYLSTPESVEVSKNGSNVVFSMQGRRLSSFPSLKVTTDQGVPDFDAEISMTGEEDSNSRSEDTVPKKKTFKKSNIASNTKGQNSSNGVDKNPPKGKSVWFAERPQVREIECRNSTTSQQKQSAINAISSTINKISANKQHFASKIFSSPSTTKSTINLSDTNKISKSNHLIIKNRITTTESSPATAALKSAQEKDLLQILFPEAFATPPKPERKNSESKTKSPALIKAAISSSFNLKSNNSHEIKNRRESVTPYSVSDVFSFKNENGRKSMSIGSDRQSSHSDFDKYLERKKLLKPPPPPPTKQKATPKTKNIIPKTEKSKTKRPRKSKNNNTMALIANDPKLGNQMKPIVVLNHVEGPVFILRSGISSETFTEISPGVFKLKQSLPPMITATAKPIPAIRTKSLSDILSDVVVQEMTAAAIPNGKEKSQDDDVNSVAILADNAENVEKQHDLCPLPPAPVVAVTVSESLTQLEDKEKEEEEGKIEETVQPEIVPLSNAAVKSQDELELKQIKKEEMELKTPSAEVTAHVISSKPVLDCFKKPLKSMAQKRLASASFIHGTPKSIQAPKSTPVFPIPQEVIATPPENVVSNRQEIQEPVTSTNSHLFPPLTSESESDSSCRTEQTGDIESSEQSDSSQSLISLRRTLKVRLRRHVMAPRHSEYSIVSNSVMDEMKSKAADGARKRRERKSLEKKGEALKRIFERADSSTSSAPPKNLDQQPPQSGLINGVLVPSIEAMNTPPPTPPTTVDDKSSVADDTSQEAKSQTTPEPSNIDQSHPPVIYENSENVQDVENNAEVLSSNIPPIKIRENGENLQVHANQVFNFKSSPGQRRRFESLNLPSKNQKRPRKKSTTEASDDISSMGTSRSQLKKRRKTICTDVFNPPDISSDEEICSSEAAADSPTTLDVMQMYMFARGLQPSKLMSSTLKNNRQDEPSSVRLNNEEISPSPNDLCDSSRLSPTLATLNPTSTTSTPTIEAEQMECGEGSPCSSRPNLDCPATPSRNLAVSRTYSKSNMVQQVFVPPEIEMFIEEPTKLAVEQPTPSCLVSTTPHVVTQRKASCSNKQKKPRNKFTTTDEEEEADDPRDEDYQGKPRKSMKSNKRGRKRGAPRGRRRQ